MYGRHIVFSLTLNEHLFKLKPVFRRLENFNFKIQPCKFEFLRKEVVYLGHIVTKGGIKPNPQKVEAIMKFPIPKDPKDIKSFLGLAGYYRRFIKNFS